MRMPFSLQKTFFLPRIFLQAGIGWWKCCHCPSSDMASSIGAQGQLQSLSSAFNSFWVLCLLWSDDALIRKRHFTTSQTQSLKKLQFSKLTSMVSWGIWTSICPCGFSFFGVNLGLLCGNPFLRFCRLMLHIHFSFSGVLFFLCLQRNTTILVSLSTSSAFFFLILVYLVVGLWHSAQQGTGSSEIAAQECWRTGIWCWFCWLCWASTWGLLHLLSLDSGYIIIASNINKVWMSIPPKFCCHDSMSARDSSWICFRCKCIELNEKERQTGWLCGLVYRTVTSKFTWNYFFMFVWFR